MAVTADQARELLVSARVARLATVGDDGRPHLVPITFALADRDTLITAVDHKPKRTRDLRRLRNIAANPAVCVLADHYEDDWSGLWWVRADGVAQVREVADQPGELSALMARYPQYAARSPDGPLIVISVERWTGWDAAAPAQ